MRSGTGSYSSVVLVGGTSEIGQAIVRALPLSHDATVWLAARRDPQPHWPAPPAALRHLPWDADDAGHSPLPPVDAGDIDVAILAVGVLGDQDEAERNPDTARHTATVNFSALVPVLLETADRLLKQGHGTLIVLSSVAGVRTRRANYVYGASKAALDAFALGLSDRFVDSGAHLLIARPGFVHGRMTAGLDPAPFATTPAAVGRAVASRLANRPDGVVWIPPVLGPLFGVLRLLPRPLFRRLPG